MKHARKLLLVLFLTIFSTLAIQSQTTMFDNQKKIESNLGEEVVTQNIRCNENSIVYTVGIGTNTSKTDNEYSLIILDVIALREEEELITTFQKKTSHVYRETARRNRQRQNTKIIQSRTMYRRLAR